MTDPRHQILPPLLLPDPTSQAWAEASARLQELDLAPLLVYLVDHVPAALLPILAEQFKTPPALWVLAETEDERRQLVKRTLSIMKKKGTPWAIREALKAAGFTDVQILERLQPTLRNGTVRRNRAIQRYGPEANLWAHYRVLVDLGNSKGLDAGKAALVRAGIESMAPLRSVLQSLRFGATVATSAGVAEDVQLGVRVHFHDVVGGLVRRDGSIRRNGRCRRGHQGDAGATVTIRRPSGTTVEVW